MYPFAEIDVQRARKRPSGRFTGNSDGRRNLYSCSDSKETPMLTDEDKKRIKQRIKNLTPEQIKAFLLREAEKGNPRAIKALKNKTYPT